MKTLHKILLTLLLTVWMAPLTMASPAPQMVRGGIELGKGGGQTPPPTPTPKPKGPPKSEDE